MMVFLAARWEFSHRRFTGPNYESTPIKMSVW